MERLSANKQNGVGEAFDPHAPITHTKSPIVQGTSVLGVKYKVTSERVIFILPPSQPFLNFLGPQPHNNIPDGCFLFF
jgi:hypothetical protein